MHPLIFLLGLGFSASIFSFLPALQPATPVEPIVEEPIPADWQTYENTSLGFRFRYPPFVYEDSCKIPLKPRLTAKGAVYLDRQSEGQTPTHCSPPLEDAQNYMLLAVGKANTAKQAAAYLIDLHNKPECSLTKATKREGSNREDLSFGRGTPGSDEDTECALFVSGVFDPDRHQAFFVRNPKAGGGWSFEYKAPLPGQPPFIADFIINHSIEWLPPGK